MWSILPFALFFPSHSLRKMFLFFQIRTLGMLRSRFESLPGAFNACLIPEEQGEPKKKGLKATLSRNFSVVSFFYLKFSSFFILFFVPNFGMPILFPFFPWNFWLFCRFHLTKRKRVQDLLNCGIKLSAVLGRKIL